MISSQTVIEAPPAFVRDIVSRVGTTLCARPRAASQDRLRPVLIKIRVCPLTRSF